MVSPALALDQRVVDCGATALALRTVFQEEASRGTDGTQEAAAIAGGIVLQAMWIIADETQCSADMAKVYGKMEVSARRTIRAIEKKTPGAGFDEFFETLSRQLDNCRKQIGQDRFDEMTAKVRKFGPPCEGSN